MDINKTIAKELGIKESQVENTIKLIDEGNTIPFIARYRKEVTGSLDDEILRNLSERLTYIRNLEEKKEQVLSSIDDQGKLTEELKTQIENSKTLVAVDDLYRPYRPKKRTRATIAKEKGLEPLSEVIIAQDNDKPIVEKAKEYIDKKKGVGTVEEAVAFAKDIVAEQISDGAKYRKYIRDFTMKRGSIVSSIKDIDSDEKKVYEIYYEYEESIQKAAGHRILALNRGEKEKILNVKIKIDKDGILDYLESDIITRKNVDTEKLLIDIIEDSYTRLIAPAVERDIRNELTEKAEDGAIKVFSENLNQLLMQPPISDQVVLGWDPAFRTGCKIAVIDETGKVLDTTVVYPTEPTTPEKIKKSKEEIKSLIKRYNVSVIALGNGTASRESEAIIVEIIKESEREVGYVVVNEAGASVYSASKLATREFPNFDAGQRSAASIARRLEDPLAELVKIDPKSIGVGQYQHDMNQKKLDEALVGVVESCVNKVGVDLNTASALLLSYVAGISMSVAENIVIYREENGKFDRRNQLKKIAKLGPKAFKQCAGFLRIKEGKLPLDNTGVHPESYEATRKLLNELGYSDKDISMGKLENISSEIGDYKETAAKLDIGEITLRDIVKELEKPGRDPRDEMPKPVLRQDVLDMKDLKEGMKLKGTVRNVIDFGAFVDIGVHQDGLVHISKLANKFVKHPLDVVNIGDVVDVTVLGVDTDKKRISLSMVD